MIGHLINYRVWLALYVRMSRLLLLIGLIWRDTRKEKGKRERSQKECTRANGILEEREHALGFSETGVLGERVKQWDYSAKKESKWGN